MRYNWWKRAKRRASLIWNDKRVLGYLVLALSGLLVYALVSVEGDAETVNVGVARWSGVATAVSAFAALAVVVLTLEVVNANRDAVTETRNARLAQSRPQVLVSFEVDEEDQQIYVVIGHYGGGLARNVRFDFKPPLVNLNGDNIGALPPIATGITMVVPGHRQRVRFEDFSDYRLHFMIDEDPKGVISHPSKYAVTIWLRDPLANDIEYRTTYVLDLEHLMTYTRSKWETVTPDDPRYEGIARALRLPKFGGAENDT